MFQNSFGKTFTKYSYLPYLPFTPVLTDENKYILDLSGTIFSEKYHYNVYIYPDNNNNSNNT